MILIWFPGQSSPPQLYDDVKPQIEINGDVIRNKSAVDFKPVNEISDYKSSQDIFDTKPSNTQSNYGPQYTEQLYTVVIPAGQPIGLLMALTYPEAGTVQSPFTS